MDREKLIWQSNKDKLLYNKIKEQFWQEIFQLFKEKSVRYIRSALIYLFEILSKRIDLDYIVDQYSKDRFVQLSTIPQYELIKLDNLIYGVANKYWFEWKEISPVAPAFIDTILSDGSINNKNTLQTIRVNQVVADVTTVLSLESAKIRENFIKKWKSEDIIELCSSHRCLRTQYFPPELKFLPHYQIFALTSAWKKIGWFTKEREIFWKHLEFYLNLFNLLSQNNFNFKKINIYISDIRIAEKIISKLNLDRKYIWEKTTNLNYSILSELSDEYKSVSKIINIDNVDIEEVSEYVKGLKLLEKKLISQIKERLRSNLDIEILYDLWRVAWVWYYDSYCFKITAINSNNNIIPLVDAWFSDWTRKIMKNDKEFFFSSGIGTELLIKYFKN